MQHTIRTFLAAALLLAVSAPLTAQDTVWTRRFDTGGYDWSMASTVDREGNVYQLGDWCDNPDFENPRILLVKYNNRGETLWSRVHDGPYDDFSGDVTIDARGDVVVAGTWFAQGGGESGVTLLKYGPDGDPVWVSNPVQTSAVFDGAVLTDDSLNVYFCGASSAGGPHLDVLLVKCAAGGGLLRSRTFDLGGDDDDIQDLAWDRDGCLVGIGRTGGFPPGNSDLVIARFNRDCDTMLVRRFDLADIEEGTALAPDGSGGFAAVGNISEPSGFPGQCFLARLTPSLDTAWSRRLALGDGTYASEVALGRAGELLVAGSIIDTSSGTRKSSLLLAKCAPNGDTLLSWRFRDRGEAGDGVGLDDSGYVYVSTTSWTEDSSDFLLIKLRGVLDIAEQPPPAVRPTPSATVCRGALSLPPSPFALRTSLFS
ncbi:hypothetical protein FJY71_05490, partial [candidate division WOR-3 bacterium]|nr:hypothetical protein [candidate division WOR-3 bacterium]